MSITATIWSTVNTFMGAVFLSSFLGLYPHPYALLAAAFMCMGNSATIFLTSKGN